MKTERSASHLDHGGIEPARNAWTRFWFTPIPATGLHCLRIGSGLLILFWLLSLLGHQEAFFSLNGWVDRQAFLALQEQQTNAPLSIGWSILYLANGSHEGFQALYWCSIAVLALFTLGVATRITGVLAWVIVVSFLSNPVANFEGDYLLVVLAFYLMIGYLLKGAWSGNLSQAERLLGSRHDFVLARWFFPRSGETPPSYAVNWTLRLLQIHFALIVVMNGLHKLQMGDWWSGAALFYPLHPPFLTTVESLQREMASATVTFFFMSIAQYMVLGWEIAFPAFAWRKGWWRAVLLGGAVIYWAGVVFVFRLPIFGPFVMLGCLSYLDPDEWAWIRRKLLSGWGKTSESVAATESKKVPVGAGKESVKK